ncbi:LysR substrate-binding domain-containing protein [Actibacterium sp. XHP0104]|uniref:LysR substrate-binding domain-containing protein n=1 Tax=Actibacterium sp. XHP0104 TaxID=2984335 RepID=UPI0021E7815E|nr:LysR substrate-binding domain-containing protein [Actibacterium sp. XHP0104]MCV2882703.1 LysR substrate-binding domain-containing protein [Actibacterium sp. XHP0104]
MPRSYTPSIAELEAFVACARMGTTVQAADRLNLTQSAVSRSLAALENRLGVLLFNRVRRRLILSDAGQAFLDRAERLLDDLNDASAAVIAFGGQAEILRMAVLPSFGRFWLVPRLARFARQRPETTFDIAARLTPVDFAQEPFDLAIMRSTHEPPGTHAQRLLAEEMVIVAAPELLDGRAQLQPEEILELPLLQQSTRPTLWLDWFRDTGCDPRQSLRGARFDHFDMVIEAATCGLGVGLVPDLIARKALAEGGLKLASPRRFATGDSYSLILPESARASPAIRAFRDWLVAEMAEAPPA